MTGSLRALTLGICLGATAFAVPKRLEAGERVPDVTVESIDGQEIRLAPTDAEDAPISVIVFIDPDQEATRRLLTDLTEIHAGLDSASRRVRWIVVASGELTDAENTALADIARARRSLQVGSDPERTAYAAFGVKAVPTTFVVGTDGVVDAALPGRSSSYRSRLLLAVRLARGEDVAEDEEAATESEESKRARRLVAAANNLLARQRRAEAATVLAEACELRPDDVALATRLGDLYLDLRQGDDALAAFDRALSLEPKLRRARQGRACAVALGDDLDAAESALRDALKKPPRAARLYYFLGLVLERRGDPAAAAAAFRQAYETLHDRGE